MTQDMYDMSQFLYPQLNQLAANTIKVTSVNSLEHVG